MNAQDVGTILAGIGAAIGGFLAARRGEKITKKAEIAVPTPDAISTALAAQKELIDQQSAIIKELRISLAKLHEELEELQDKVRDAQLRVKEEEELARERVGRLYDQLLQVQHELSLYKDVPARRRRNPSREPPSSEEGE